MTLRDRYPKTTKLGDDAASTSPRAFGTLPRFRREPLLGLSEEERDLFERFGRGASVAAAHDRIHHPFERWARTQPEAIAVEHEGESIDYATLDARAARLAEVLRRRGVEPGDAVCLFVRRSVAMVVGILATLKCGAAYVPQDVGTATASQLRHVVAVTDARVVLTLAVHEHAVPHDTGVPVLAIERVLTGDLARPAAPRPVPRSRPDAAEAAARAGRCFILFTSGTTGHPNGVQVTHANVCNLLLGAPGNLGIGPGTRVGQILSIAFDMAAWETLVTLANGGTLVLRGSDFQALAARVHVLIATPSVLGRIDPAGAPDVHTVAVAGEPCPRPLADLWGARAAFHIGCGPTETTIVNTLSRYRPGDERLTIGKPTPNNTVYVLDAEGRPCRIGEIGEMWAGGDCVSTGYVGNEALTAERYAPDPFLGGDRVMFRTRDLGRWTADGALEHFGRTDDQVKVRGFRVELDSVSRALESAVGCIKAVTVKLDDRRLAAAVSPATVDPERAREAVAVLLPYYCVPEVVLPMDDIPMTDRGKSDRRRLLALARERVERVERVERERSADAVVAGRATGERAEHGTEAAV